MWFEKLMGFEEVTPQQVRENIILEGNKLISKVNGESYIYGDLEIPSLAELRERTKTIIPTGRLKFSEQVANVQLLHENEANTNALFQVASQFNLLEMVNPSITPEQGIDIYEHDYTQGPACAIAAGAGTTYRNYFVRVNDQIGQTATSQIDCIKDLGTALGNKNGSLWQMRNGYVIRSKNGLETIDQQLRKMTETEKDQLRSLLRIGIQWQTQVTLNGAKHVVSQTYNSALPVAYHSFSDYWENFARLILDASYEATFHAALLNQQKTGNNKVYLTLIGGGAFGNRMDWIIGALKRSLKLFAQYNLDVIMVSYRISKPSIQAIVKELEH